MLRSVLQAAIPQKPLFLQQPLLSRQTNWQTNQTVTITGVNDSDSDGHQGYGISLTAEGQETDHHEVDDTLQVQELRNFCKRNGHSSKVFIIQKESPLTVPTSMWPILNNQQDSQNSNFFRSCIEPLQVPLEPELVALTERAQQQVLKSPLESPLTVPTSMLPILKQSQDSPDSNIIRSGNDPCWLLSWIF